MSIQDCIEDWLTDMSQPSSFEVFDLSLLWIQSTNANLSDWDKETKAEKSMNRVVAALNSKKDCADRKQIPCLFSFDTEVIQNDSTIFRYDHPRWKQKERNQNVIENKNMISQIRHIKNALEKLDNEKSLAFEIFCSDLLNKISGYDIYIPQQRSQDGGIDFFGYFQSPEKQGVGITPHRVFGQVKRWSRKINPSEAHHFQSQMDEFNKGYGQAWKILPDEFKNSKIPLHGYFLTSGFYTRQAEATFNKGGIYTRDGLQLAWGVIFKMSEWFDGAGNFLASKFVSSYQERADHFPVNSGSFK